MLIAEVAGMRVLMPLFALTNARPCMLYSHEASLRLLALRR